MQRLFTMDRKAWPMDDDETQLLASTRKLLDIVERTGTRRLRSRRRTMETTEKIATILRVNFTFLERSGIRGAYVHLNNFEKMTARSGPFHESDASL